MSENRSDNTWMRRKNMPRAKTKAGARRMAQAGKQTSGGACMPSRCETQHQQHRVPRQRDHLAEVLQLTVRSYSAFNIGGPGWPRAGDLF